jgi:type II secretory pathway component GspD/PulD (secretin)
MARFVFACLLIGSSCCAAVADSGPSANAPRYVAKVKFLRVDGGKQIIAVDTEVTGTKGTPLKTNLGGKDGLVLKLDMRDVPGGTPSQYVIQFKLIETKNGKESVLSAPTIMTTAGRPAKLMVGQEKGDRIEVDLTVREVAATASSHGTSLMKMVNPRIIIQDEEEDRMEIQSSP